MQPEEVKRLMREKKICVIVPTYNNAASLPHVLNDLMIHGCNIIVVNDGSTDSTPDILSTYKERVEVVSYPRNRGKGHALREGFRKAIESGFNYAVTIDSDGQHFPSDLHLFVRGVVEYPDSIIIGERDLSDVDINGKSSFANKFSNFWFAVQTGKRLRDTQTGYRCYPLHHLSGLHLLTSRYEAELELLVFAAWKGVSIHPVKIDVFYPSREERISHFRPGLDFTRISILNTILCFAALFYGLPRGIWNGFKKRRFFNFEFHPFTRKKGEKRETALTLDRILRSFYALGYFIPKAIYFRVWTSLSFRNITGENESKEDRKRLILHRRLTSLSKKINRRYPKGRVSYENVSEEIFSHPAILVCNHQSHLDLPTIMAVNPKIVFLTNDRVWKNPIYGNVIREAQCFPVSEGIEVLLPKLQKIVEKGYSIMIFPEGTRSETSEVRRFHKGAFLLAEMLGLDIVPMVIHGIGDYLPKNDAWLREGDMTLKVLPRIPAEELISIPLIKRPGKIRRVIMQALSEIAEEKEGANYFLPLVRYKYSWRGWKVMSMCKKDLRKVRRGEIEIPRCPSGSKVRVVNSGIGVFPLLLALVNRNSLIYAFEERMEEFNIFSTTSNLPANLRVIHALTEKEYSFPEGEEIIFDITIDNPMKG